MKIFCLSVLSLITTVSVSQTSDFDFYIQHDVSRPAYDATICTLYDGEPQIHALPFSYPYFNELVDSVLIDFNGIATRHSNADYPRWRTGITTGAYPIEVKSRNSYLASCISDSNYLIRVKNADVANRAEVGGPYEETLTFDISVSDLGIFSYCVYEYDWANNPHFEPGYGVSYIAGANDPVHPPGSRIKIPNSISLTNPYVFNKYHDLNGSPTSGFEFTNRTNGLIGFTEYPELNTCFYMVPQGTPFSVSTMDVAEPTLGFRLERQEDVYIISLATDEQQAKVEIFDMAGRNQAIGKSGESLDLSHLAKGLYIAHVIASDGRRGRIKFWLD